MSTVHVVTGAGPVGSTVAHQLADAGHQVRLLTRSGSGPDHPLIERRRVDVSQPEALAEAFDGRGRGPPLHPRVGVRRPRLAGRAPRGRACRARGGGPRRRRRGLPGEPLLLRPGRRPDDRGPARARRPRGKLGVRTELLAQREASATPTVSVAASDFYGPLVRMAHAGERLVPTVLAGRTMRVRGQPGPAALLHLRARPGRRDDRRGRATRSCGTRSSTPPPRPRSPSAGSSSWSRPRAACPSRGCRRSRLRCCARSGVVSREMRELAETSYMFARPFVLDSSASEQRLGLTPRRWRPALEGDRRRGGASRRARPAEPSPTGVRTSNPRHTRHSIAFGPCSPRSSSPTAARSQSVPSEPRARSARRRWPSSPTRTAGPSTG